MRFAFLLAGSDRGDRNRHLLVHLLAQTMIRKVDIAARKVCLEGGLDIGVTFADLRADELARVFLGVRARKPLRLGSPERHGFVAARYRLEAQVLVMGGVLFTRAL